MGIKIRKTEDLPQMQELFLGQGKGEGLRMINETLFIAYDMGTSSLYEALYFMLAVISFFVVLWLIKMYNQKQRGVKDV